MAAGGPPSPLLPLPAEIMAIIPYRNSRNGEREKKRDEREREGEERIRINDLRKPLEGSQAHYCRYRDGGLLFN